MSPRCQYSGFSFTTPPPVSHLSVTESSMKTAEPSIHTETNDLRALFPSRCPMSTATFHVPLEHVSIVLLQVHASCATHTCLLA